MAEPGEMNANPISLLIGVKKRTRKPEEWQREKRKRLRVAGKEYINTRGDLVSGRRIGEDCKCRRKCYVNVSEEVRLQLFKGYYSLKTHDEQNAYLFGLIRRQDVARKRSKNSIRRTCTYTYYVRNRGKETQVCRLAFAHIHGISSPKIRNLCLKLDMNVMFPRDGRGKHDHRPKKISDEKIQQVRQHINSITRSDQIKDFMKEEKNCGPDVNITKMWKDYLQRYEPSINLETVSSKPQRSDLKPKHKTRQGDQERLHSQSQNASIGRTLNCRSLKDHSNLGLSHMSARNANAQEQHTNCLSLINFDKINSSDCKESLSDGGSNEEDKMTKKVLPVVKHWLYSKVFHEEVRNQDIVALRKKLWDVKREDHSSEIISAALDSNLSALGTQSSKQPLFGRNKALLKSKRKQRTPKNVLKVKENDTLDAESRFGTVVPKDLCEMPAQINSSTQEVYILPLHIEEIHQQTPHTTLMTIDLMTSPPPPPAHQHFFPETECHEHSYPDKDHLTGSDQGGDGVQQSTPSSNELSTDTTQRYCNFMNLGNTQFY